MPPQRATLQSPCMLKLVKHMIRLGFAVRVLGRATLRGRGPSAPHLSVSLARLLDIIDYLEQVAIGFYRIDASILSADRYAEIEECAELIDTLAFRIAQRGVRLSTHLDLHCGLGVVDDRLAGRNLATIETLAYLFERLDAYRPLGMVEGVLVSHVGGSTQDPATLDRFCRRYAALSERARLRLCVEHDDAGHSLVDLLALHQRCGVALVFDALHHRLNNPAHVSLPVGLGLALSTWPERVRPKAHVSSPRSEAHLIPARAGVSAAVLPPRPGQHADFLVVDDVQNLLLAAQGLPEFDLMIEAKAGDLALLRLRSELSACMPALALRVA
jgi:UV DNA damage endonuclease